MNFSLKHDHYLRILFEFTLYMLCICLAVNIPNIYMYFAYGKYAKSLLDIFLLPAISFTLFMIRFGLVFVLSNISYQGFGRTTRLYEKGIGWYEYSYTELDGISGLYNSEELAANAEARKAISRHSFIQGIEYTYEIRDKEKIELVFRKQYFRGLSAIELMKILIDKEAVKIKTSSVFRKKSYIA